MVCTNQEMLHKIIRSMRDWGRDCTCPPGTDNRCGHRFDGQYGTLPQGYDHKYVYSHFGYNLKGGDCQAAIGCAQMQKLPAFVAKRNANHAYLCEALASCTDRLILPEATPHATPSWFGLLLCCREGVSRDAVVAHLEREGVQTRMLFAGNLVRQPCFDHLRRAQSGYRVVGELAVTDRVMRDGFIVGVYPGMGEQALERVAALIREAVKK